MYKQTFYLNIIKPYYLFIQVDIYRYLKFKCLITFYVLIYLFSKSHMYKLNVCHTKEKTRNIRTNFI